jgi:vacuolar-type H+-ATPase subunit D/Vma8
MIQLGLAVALRDALAEVAETYTNLDKVIRELNRFERRGEGAVRRGKQTLRRRRRDIEHDVRSARRDVKRQTNGLRSDAEDVVQRIKNLA